MLLVGAQNSDLSIDAEKVYLQRKDYLDINANLQHAIISVNGYEKPVGIEEFISLCSHSCPWWWGLNSFVSVFTNADVGRTYIDDDGVLQSAAADAPRFETVGGRRGVLLEPVGTNNLLYARDLTQAEWVESNATTALDQIGEDGVVNSASSFLATAANATVLQTLVLAAADYAYSVSIKRITGTGNIEVTDDNGGAWTDISGSLSTAAWYRHTITRSQANPICGIRIVTNTDKISVDFNQLEAGKFASSRILTTVAVVTRTTESTFPYWTLPTGLFDDKGTAIVWWRPGYPASAHSAVVKGILTPVDTSVGIMQTFEDDIYSADAGANLAIKTAAWIAANIWYKLVVKWGYLVGVQKKFRVGVDTGVGVSWGTEQDFDGSYTLGSYLRLGYNLFGRMHMQSVMLFPIVLTDSQIDIFEML